MKKMELTLLIQKTDDGWYIGRLQEYPPVMSQGKTIDELKENVLDALKLYLEDQKADMDKENSKKKIIKRKLVFMQ